MSPAYETINPWAWQDQFGFSQAVATPSPHAGCSSQAKAPQQPTEASCPPGDIGDQLTQALDNLETVQGAAGCGYGRDGVGAVSLHGAGGPHPAGTGSGPVPSKGTGCGPPKPHGMARY